ncbi:DC1, C1-like, Zinc finger, PHD-type, conserved site [Artemisia annua]|uniref:DC1, C1-like, Zinc finger, PHD-type, conserved site n=1 Tax=Artemisia annua TaxID=35608 RepID=A0A2U1L0Y5_ARTAN|nr:DC1, C1-like, Zinc finger, PHD-type, conserved site [Artemisia annua]
MGRLLKNFKDDDYPDLVRLPFPDQTMNLIRHLFSKEIESSTSETNEAKQRHISHEHPLILVDTTKATSSTLSCHDPMKKVELICNGCVRPIMDSPFYTCADEDEHRCNFALHEWCTRLPFEIKNHPGHPKHTLVFKPKVPYKPFGVFECDICELPCNGFVYCCIECEYNVDVCCAFIPDKITHKAHENHLLSRVTKRLLGDTCRLCFWYIYSYEFTFSCQDCGFHIHPGCALLLSETIRHKYDKHPLKLSYLPIENHKGDYFCDICEVQFYPEREGSFYHCEKCVHSMHPACSMPIFRHKNPVSFLSILRGRTIIHKYVNIKLGGRLNIDTHPHPLSFVQGLKSHGQCSAQCGLDLDYQIILKCLKCEFAIHHDCVGE